jgi:hypothetical protein
MRKVRTLAMRGSLIALRSHVVFTLRRLQGNPLTATLALRFEALLASWKGLFQTELDLHDQIDDAQVAVTAVDGKLNRFARRVSKEILTITGDDRAHMLYQHTFGSKTLYAFQRHVLSDKLEAMRQWIADLQASQYATLKALGSELVPLIAQADKAARGKADAEQALARFRDVGPRKRYIDQVNIARKETHGVLASLPHKHTGLPANFADEFFRHVQVKRDEEPTVTSVEAEINALQEDLAAKQVELTALNEQAKETKTKEEERAAALAKLKALDAEVAAKQKEAEALRAALDAASGS